MAAAAGDALQHRLAEIKGEIDRLRANVELVKARVQNGGLGSVDAPPRRALGPVLKRKKVLTGHVSRVNAIDWAGDSMHVVSASQDGKMIIWNALTNHKMQVIALRSSWVMTCAFERDTSSLVACGGLDNVCTIYSTGGVGPQGGTTARISTELHGHDGYVSSARFTDGGAHMLTASGDSTCIYWDVERAEVLGRFTDHTSDVMSVAPCPEHPALFVSGSTDSTAKAWDLRSGKCTQTFVGHESDINAVAYMRHGQVFGTASDDCTVKVFEQRSYSRVNEMANDTVMFASTSLDFSASGRILFAGYDDCNAYGWDTLADSAQSPVQALLGHSNRVSCVGVSPSGEALCTGSWDHDISIWA